MFLCILFYFTEFLLFLRLLFLLIFLFFFFVFSLFFFSLYLDFFFYSRMIFFSSFVISLYVLFLKYLFFFFFFSGFSVFYRSVTYENSIISSPINHLIEVLYFLRKFFFLLYIKLEGSFFLFLKPYFLLYICYFYCSFWRLFLPVLEFCMSYTLYSVLPFRMSFEEPYFNYILALLEPT